MIKITKAELTQAKRALLVLNDLAKLALEMTNKSEPLEVKQDRLALVNLLKRLDAVAK